MKRIVFRISWLPRAACWKVKSSDPDLGPTYWDLKAEAIAHARRLAGTIEHNGGLAQVIVKNRNGRIATEYTYGDDPRRHAG